MSLCLNPIFRTTDRGFRLAEGKHLLNFYQEVYHSMRLFHSIFNLALSKKFQKPRPNQLLYRNKFELNSKYGDQISQTSTAAMISSKQICSLAHSQSFIILIDSNCCRKCSCVHFQQVAQLLVKYIIIVMNKTGGILPKQTNKFSVQKLQNSYITALEQIVKLLSQMLVHLCDQDTVQNLSINQLTHLCSELKYIEKLKNESEKNSLQLNKYIQQALGSIKNKNQQFPKIKQMKSQNNGELSTIQQKYSQQNILSNYLRKNSHNRSNKYHNYSELQKYSETLNISSDVFREETRKSLDNSRQKQKKPLYNELQKIKTKQSNANSFRIYHEPKKHILKSRLPQYNISKLI